MTISKEKLINYLADKEMELFRMETISQNKRENIKILFEFMRNEVRLIAKKLDAGEFDCETD